MARLDGIGTGENGSGQAKRAHARARSPEEVASEVRIGIRMTQSGVSMKMPLAKARLPRLCEGHSKSYGEVGNRLEHLANS